ncbi:serine hydrolase [Chitinophaga sp. Cy-1792]|uniref:serine hydrolase domain-containing protein n=1 Tax=Chitinophaga sp. Cy-1792 TaxID=2608339 RepID=UPI00141E258D|nr:serine hydrolase domain-containing protein [Chitinophaga sp. Cy-1792]NIG54073.1 beta-lactamase family protein [Chitinophaga sp. Cy-1792]
MLTLVLSVLLSGPSTAPKANTIDSLLKSTANAFMQDSARAGVSIGIVKDGKTYFYNAGVVNKRSSRTPDNHTLYEIGSVTKTFAGVLLAQAAAEGRLHLDDDIRKYLKEDYPNLAYKGTPIKLSQLLNHTSGLPFFLPDRKDLFQQPQDSLPGIVVATQNNYSKKQFLQDLHQVTLDTLPGTKFSYSNAAAQLMGYILEDMYQSSFSDLVKKYITTPQNMPLTSVHYSKKDVERLSTGYNGKGQPMPYNPPLIAAAGSITSCVADMVNYLKFHLNENNKVIATTHQATFGDINSFAIGLNWQMMKTAEGHRKIWQSGGSFGFSSYCAVFPEENLGIVILTNEADRTAQPALGEMADKFRKALNE